MQARFRVAGNNAFKAGKWTEAVEGYTRAIELDPEDKVTTTYNRAIPLAYSRGS